MDNKKKLLKARRNIDKIDNKIFKLVVKRTQVVKFMLSVKKFRKDIVDKKRINEILKKIHKKSIRHGVDSKISKRIWKSMIWSYIEYQKKNFKKK